ncbi:MAG: IS110 family transposase [Planctomycetota bacterium]|nr:IS110 family transposase [Planctomycetota bacterium]
MTNLSNEGVVNSDAIRTDAVVTPLALAIKLGIDAHADSYVVVRQVDQAVPQPAQRFTLEGLMAFMRRQVAVAQAVHSCYEAGPLGYVLHRRLTALGVHNLVVRPRDWSTYGERVKTDSRDAAALCSCLDRHLAGNPGALASVHVPSEAEEQRRAVARQRTSLQQERVRLTLKGKSAALLRGHRLAKEWWRPRELVRLAEELPPDLHALLLRWQLIILPIDAQLQILTEQLEESAPTGLPTGLGAMSWELIAREVGDWHRFHNRRQVASYTGLCPSEHSSGKTRAQGSITRHGNPRLRHLLVEAVWRMFVFQPDYHGIVKWREALAARKLTAGRKKKIIVAIARQLAVDLWRLGTGRTTASALGLQTPA